MTSILDQVFHDLRPNAVTTPRVCCYDVVVDMVVVVIVDMVVVVDVMRL